MYKKFFKRFFDITVSLFALPFFLILLLIIAPTIYLSDKGSIFYNSPRLGKDGKIYKMYKFRSMKINSPDYRNEDGSTFNASNDPRLTRIGKLLRKTSIDEIPQIFNIIKGNMSIIGPRPDLPCQIDLYEKNEFKKLNIRPGITGYNQAYFRNTIPWKDRIKNDIFYVENYSFLLDIKIFIKTIISVFKTENIYAQKDNQEVLKKKSSED